MLRAEPLPEPQPVVAKGEEAQPVSAGATLHTEPYTVYRLCAQ